MSDDEKPDKEARKRVAEWWDKPEHTKRPDNAAVHGDLDDPKLNKKEKPE